MHRLDELPEKGKKGSPGNSPVQKAVTDVGTKSNNFTTADVELALRVLALNGGNYSKTSRELEKIHNLPIDSATLSKWRKVSFANRYDEIAVELRKTIGDSLSNRLIENASLAADTTHELITTLADNQADLETEDLSKVAKDLASISGTSIEKAALLRGQPTDIVEERKPELILEELKKLGVRFGGVQE